MTSKYLSVNEAAKLLNISDRAIRQRIKAHTIQAEKVGNAWRIYSAQLREDTEPTDEPHAMIDFLKSPLASPPRTSKNFSCLSVNFLCLLGSIVCKKLIPTIIHPSLQSVK